MQVIRRLGPQVVEGLRNVRRAEALVRGRCLRVGSQVLDHCRGGAQKMLPSAVAEAVVASITSTADVVGVREGGVVRDPLVRGRGEGGLPVRRCAAWGIPVRRWGGWECDLPRRGRRRWGGRRGVSPAVVTRDWSLLVRRRDKAVVGWCGFPRRGGRTQQRPMR